MRRQWLLLNCLSRISIGSFVDHVVGLHRIFPEWSGSSALNLAVHTLSKHLHCRGTLLYVIF